MLKQGLGRLIRSGADRGILAVLDSRLVEKPLRPPLPGQPASGAISCTTWKTSRSGASGSRAIPPP